MRLNKFISHNTPFSRREADRLIKEGKVKVNGKIELNPAYQVKEDDEVKLFNKRVKRKVKFTCIVYYKQKGELTTKKDPLGRKTIYDTLPKRFRHFVYVGRLDFTTTGLLILTDSKKLASILTNGNWERTYYVKIRGNITEKMIEAMENGIEIDSKKGAHPLTKITKIKFAPFIKYKIISNKESYSKLKVSLIEGKNREIRRFFAYFDREVVDLKRVEYGGISLDLRKPGSYRYFSKSEYESARKLLEEYEKSKDK